MARIFICGDTGQPELLAQAAATLAADGHEVVRGPANVEGMVRQYPPAERAAWIDGADVAVFTVRHACSRALLAGASRLRGVCYTATGVESLDLDAAAALGIIVGHGAVPANVVGMAEATIMLMLMLLSDVRTNIGLIERGHWRRPGHHGRALDGKAVGLVGFGRIARAVAARLAPFGARILTASPRLRPADLPDNVAKVDLPHLLAESDVVAILTGLSPETRHLLGASELALLKRSAVLVNTGRGAVVDEHALYEALRDRRIAGAALDTFTVEPLPADSPLRSLDNVILTPHCVGHTVESLDALGPALVENVRCILDGRLPRFCKNPEIEPAWRERLHRLQAAPERGASPRPVGADAHGR